MEAFHARGPSTCWAVLCLRNWPQYRWSRISPPTAPKVNGFPNCRAYRCTFRHGFLAKLKTCSTRPSIQLQALPRSSFQPGSADRNGNPLPRSPSRRDGRARRTPNDLFSPMPGHWPTASLLDAERRQRSPHEPPAHQRHEQRRSKGRTLDYSSATVPHRRVPVWSAIRPRKLVPCPPECGNPGCRSSVPNNPERGFYLHPGRRCEGIPYILRRPHAPNGSVPPEALHRRCGASTVSCQAPTIGPSKGTECRIVFQQRPPPNRPAIPTCHGLEVPRRPGRPCHGLTHPRFPRRGASRPYEFTLPTQAATICFFLQLARRNTGRDGGWWVPLHSITQVRPMGPIRRSRNFAFRHPGVGRFLAGSFSAKTQMSMEFNLCTPMCRAAPLTSRPPGLQVWR